MINSKQLLIQVTNLKINKLCTIGLVGRMFANGLWDRGSISGQVIPKTQKLVHDATLLNTKHYKVRIKGRVDQSRERSCGLPDTMVL